MACWRMAATEVWTALVDSTKGQDGTNEGETVWSITATDSQTQKSYAECRLMEFEIKRKAEPQYVLDLSLRG